MKPPIFATLVVALFASWQCGNGARLMPMATPMAASPIPLPAEDDFRFAEAPQMEVLNADARIFLFKNFLSEAECDYIRAKATPRLQRSGVVDTKKGGSQINDIRTSSGMFFRRGEDPIIEAIERRIANASMTPVRNAEGLQVLRYETGQKYDAHYDYFFDKVNAANGANRYATMLTFLDTVEEGGETVFTNVPMPGANPDFTPCARDHLAVKPKKGDAVLFHSMSFNGELETRSMHGACPVVKGVKWSMAKWIHAKPFRMGDKYDREAELSVQPQAHAPQEF